MSERIWAVLAWREAKVNTVSQQQTENKAFAAVPAVRSGRRGSPAGSLAWAHGSGQVANGFGQAEYSGV